MPRREDSGDSAGGLVLTLLSCKTAVPVGETRRSQRQRCCTRQLPRPVIVRMWGRGSVQQIPGRLGHLCMGPDTVSMHVT